MSASVEFLLRLVDQEQPSPVCSEDLGGVHGGILRACQALGFLATEPSVHDVPACPFCGEGTPYRLGGMLRCNRCRSRLEPDSQRSWRFDPGGFLTWLARCLGLRGEVRRVEPRLWHLGVWGKGGAASECFYQRSGPLSPLGESRLDAYQSVVVLHGLDPVAGAERPGQSRRPLSRLLVWEDERLSVRPLTPDAGEDRVRFEPRGGTLWAGSRKVGEVPLASHEFYLLECLAERPDEYVGYAELRREVLRRSGGQDGRDESTFCHEVKRRLKRRFMPEIDRYLTTNNKGAGYRLRATCPG